MYINGEQVNLARMQLIVALSQALEATPYDRAKQILVERVIFDDEEDPDYCLSLRDDTGFMDRLEEEEIDLTTFSKPGASMHLETTRNGEIKRCLRIEDAGSSSGSGGDDACHQSEFHLYFVRLDPKSVLGDVLVKRVEYYTQGPFCTEPELSQENKKWDEEKLALLQKATVDFLVYDKEPPEDLDEKLELIQNRMHFG